MALPGFTAEAACGRGAAYRALAARTTAGGDVAPAMTVCTDMGCYDAHTAAEYMGWGGFMGGSVGLGAGPEGGLIGAGIGALIGAAVCLFDSDCHF